MAKKTKTKKKKSNKKSSKSTALFEDKSIVWALISGVALAAGVIWYVLYFNR